MSVKDLRGLVRPTVTWWVNVVTGILVMVMVFGIAKNPIPQEWWFLVAGIDAWWFGERLLEKFSVVKK
jgi:hypothetical protein